MSLILFLQGDEGEIVYVDRPIYVDRIEYVDRVVYRRPTIPSFRTPAGDVSKRKLLRNLGLIGKYLKAKDVE